MHILTKLSSIALLLLVSTRIFAVEVPSIYQVEVPVISRAANVRSDAVKMALEQVLIKVSGNSRILETYPRLKAKMSQADDLVQEFAYVTSAQPTTLQPYSLSVHFDPEGVDKLLQEAGSSEWGQSRPMLVVWLAYEGLNHPTEVVSSSENPIQNVFQVSAQKRGLPVIFPVMDVTELIQVTTADVMNKNLSVLQPASQRYAGNAILMGHLSQTAAGFSSDWQLVMGNDQWSFSQPGKNLSDVFSGLINQISDTLAKRYAAVVTPNVQAKLTLKVSNLKQQTDLAVLMKYLQQVTAVSDVQLQSVDGDKAILNVNLHGTQAAFTQALALGSNLVPVPLSGPADTSQSTTLQYKWNQ
jgi:hypothetical protein